MAADFRNQLYSGKLELRMNRDFYSPQKASYKSVLETGKFKNQLELKAEGAKVTSGGANDPYIKGRRDKWEGNVFGKTYQLNPDYMRSVQQGKRIMSLDAARERPVYGYLNDSLKDGIDGRYGHVQFVLEPETTRRTTFSINNSSVCNRREVFTAENPHTLFLERGYRKEVQSWSDTGDFAGHSGRSPYNEAHIHGGTTMSDVRKIRAPSDSKYDFLQELADKYNVPFERYQAKY